MMALTLIINHVDSEEKNKGVNNLNFVRDGENVLQMKMNGVSSFKF